MNGQKKGNSAANPGNSAANPGNSAANPGNSAAEVSEKRQTRSALGQIKTIRVTLCPRTAAHLATLSKKWKISDSKKAAMIIDWYINAIQNGSVVEPPPQVVIPKTEEKNEPIE